MFESLIGLQGLSQTSVAIWDSMMTGCFAGPQSILRANLSKSLGNDTLHVTSGSEAQYAYANPDNHRWLHRARSINSRQISPSSFDTMATGH